MPIISQFYGIIISMFFNDTDKHHKPHIHVQYGEYHCSFDFDGNIIAGEIPNKQRKLVEAWIELRKEELISLWEIVQNGKRFFLHRTIKIIKYKKKGAYI